MFRQNKARKLRIPILSSSISQDSGKQELKKRCSQIKQWFLEKRQGNRWRRKKKSFQQMDIESHTLQKYFTQKWITSLNIKYKIMTLM